MVFPSLLIGRERTQPVLDVPAVRILCDVHTPAHAAARPENIRMAPSQEQRPMASHAQASDGSHIAVGVGAVMTVDILHKFLAHVGLELHFGVHR